MIEQQLAFKARRYRYWACLGWALYGVLVWVPSLSDAIPYIQSIQFIVFLFAYLLLTWSLMILMAAKRRPRWWGYFGLLGPVGLLLYFVPTAPSTNKL
ncbi:MAG: hypothetical protein CMF48_07565 [Legionellales bacterium]|nr:hypothetical protein [Legionellales bacterium]|tara:strand:- start:1806 stop:2099 length:294 start_codon:yes stop_codon:yes gene_type:complete